jgi:hypothetical protein
MRSIWRSLCAYGGEIGEAIMKERISKIFGKSALATLVAGTALLFVSPVGAMAARGGGGHPGGGGGHAYSGGAARGFSGGGGAYRGASPAYRGGGVYRGGGYYGGGGYYRGGYYGGFGLGFGVPYGYGYGYGPAYNYAPAPCGYRDAYGNWIPTACAVTPYGYGY